MLKYWFSRERELASRMTEQLTKYVPSAFVHPNQIIIGANQISSALQRCYNLALDADRRKRLTYFRRVVLAYHFLMQLQTKGYPPKLTRAALEGLLIELHKHRQANHETH